MLNAQYSKFPMVTVHQAICLESLKPVMNETFACHDIPEVVTSDRRPPYEGRDGGIL